jgi:2-dehydro-3-deoxyphosphogluconate aldolase/(4S)-4-hydroxy-2-oxoglutarate aldolase
MTAKALFEHSVIVPVVVLENADRAVGLAKALLEGGIGVMEITLRSEAALESIRRIANEVPQMAVGAGTVVYPEQMLEVKEAGGMFCFSPGINVDLISMAEETGMPFIPGVATASEVMIALGSGLQHCKLFPASAVGGIDLLKGFSGPFPSVQFCPTGGISKGNMNDYLALPNVACVGGSWIVPKNLINEARFDEITTLCNDALAYAD